MASGRPADLHWRCNPEQPDGRRGSSRRRSSSSRARAPNAVVVVDEAYVEYGARLVRAVGRRAARTSSSSARSRRRSASLRCGSAMRSLTRTPRRCSTERRAPAPIAGPAAAIGRGRAARAAARRRRGDDRRARARAGRRSRPLASTCRAVGGELRLRCARTTRSRSGSRRRESSSGASQRASASRVRRPTRERRAAARTRRGARAAAGREATVIRTTTETALRLTLALDGDGTHPRRDRNRLPRPPAHAARLPRRLRPRARRGRRPRGRRASHASRTFTPPWAPRSREALGSREGVARYGSAVVPMDEARATAAVDLVRRPHAEIELVVRRRPGRRAGRVPARARARALRDRGRLHRARRGGGGRRPPRRRGGLQGARPGALPGGRARRRGHPLDEGGGVMRVRSQRPLSVKGDLCRLGSDSSTGLRAARLLRRRVRSGRRLAERGHVANGQLDRNQSLRPGSPTARVDT